MRKTLLTIVALLSGVMSSAQTPVADVLNVVWVQPIFSGGTDAAGLVL